MSFGLTFPSRQLRELSPEKSPTYTCNDPTAATPIAGYVPSTDVRGQVKLDLDILQMKILMDTGAYSAAEDLYMYGKNSKLGGNYQSMHFLASGNYRDIVPIYPVFKNFYNDPDYADSLIMDVIHDRNEYSGLSRSMRSAIVVDSLTSMVMLMPMFSMLSLAVSQCQSGNMSTPSPWDEAVATFVGSIEGTELNGHLSSPGLLLFGLSQRQCAQFGICDSEGVSLLNKEFSSLMFKGKQNIGKDCRELVDIVKEVEALIQVPLIQSTLLYAQVNDKLEYSSMKASLGSGYAFASSIVPIVDHVDKRAAEVIEKNMYFKSLNGLSPVYQGPLSVYRAFEDAIPSMPGIKCEFVGGDMYNVCDSGVPNPPGLNPPSPSAPSPQPPTAPSPQPPTSPNTPVTAQPTSSEFLKSSKTSKINSTQIALGVTLPIILLLLGVLIYMRASRKKEGVDLTFDANASGVDDILAGIETPEKIEMKGKTEVLNTMGVVD